jgi:hypothetical protein
MKISVNFKNLDADNAVLDKLTEKYHFDGVETTTDDKKPNRQPIMKINIPNGITEETRLDMVRFGIELSASMDACVDFADNANGNDSLLRTDPIHAQHAVKHDMVDFFAVPYAASIDPDYTPKDFDNIKNKYKPISKVGIFAY